MCIRDRVDGVAALADVLDVASEGEHHVQAEQYPPGQQHACLLYTSDAADERSSVDLGGRRIIKKKKNDMD